MGESPPDLGKCRPEIANSWPNPSRILAQIGPGSGQSWPKAGQSCPERRSETGKGRLKIHKLRHATGNDSKYGQPCQGSALRGGAQPVSMSLQGAPRGGCDEDSKPLSRAHNDLKHADIDADRMTAGKARRGVARYATPEAPRPPDSLLRCCFMKFKIRYE